jgi:amino acid transporter
LSSEERRHLLRAIGRWDLTALVVNSIIGAGIFGLPAQVYALVGAWSPVAFVACGALAFVLILCFAEAGSRFRDTGGPYLYAHAAFGAWPAFAIGWLLWLARVSSFAALTNLFVTYLAWFVPGADEGAARIMSCVLPALALAALNLLGVRGSTRVGNAFALGKLAPLVLLVLAGMFFVEPARLAPGTAPPLADFGKAVLLLVYAYTGFESAIIPTGEMRDAPRDVPFALIAATLIVTAVYLGVQFVCAGMLADPGASPRPLTDAATQIAGFAGAATITVGALVSIAGTLNATLLAAPRLLFAMAERAQMPAAFARVHARFRTPHVAIALTATAMVAATLSGGFLVLVLISTIARLLVYVGTCIAVVALRRRDGAAPFRIRGGAAIPLLAVLLCLWLVAHSTWREAAVVAVALLCGVIPYAAARAWRAARATRTR